MFLVSKLYVLAQKIPEDFGYRHMAFKYQNDPVDVIIISKKGEERIPKPLFFYCQGSLPQPVIKYDDEGSLGVLPFKETALLEKFHIVVAAKPFIPAIAHISKLGRQYMFLKDYKSEIPPRGYTERNYLDYYVFRNNFIIRQLFKERWVKASGLIVAGHSEGSTIAAKMASVNSKVTRLIYASGNPYGRIATMAKQQPVEDVMAYWRNVVQHKSDIATAGGDSHKTTYSFSVPQKDNILNLKIPVLVSYGAHDDAAAYLQLLQIEAIRLSHGQIAFNRYDGWDHNFFSENGSEYHWDVVAADWMKWLGD